MKQAKNPNKSRKPYRPNTNKNLEPDQYTGSTLHPLAPAKASRRQEKHYSRAGRTKAKQLGSRRWAVCVRLWRILGFECPASKVNILAHASRRRNTNSKQHHSFLSRSHDKHSCNCGATVGTHNTDSLARVTLRGNKTSLHVNRVGKRSA